jgi:hypothetical protein
LSLLKTLRIAITDISVVIKPAVCASLAGYFTLFSLTNLAIVCMFFKFPNLVALYVSRERQCFIFTSSVIIWLLHSFWRLDRKKEWKIPMCAWLHFEYVHIGLRMNSKFHTKWSLLLIYYSSSHCLMDVLLYYLSDPSFLDSYFQNFDCVLNSAIWLHQWGFNSMEFWTCMLWDRRKTCRILS